MRKRARSTTPCAARSAQAGTRPPGRDAPRARGRRQQAGVVPNKSEAIDRALKVVRNRIDEFGVSEPVVQKVGNDRIIVELPGIDDRARAEALVQNSAFLQFQITDKTQAFDKALPRLDGVGEADRRGSRRVGSRRSDTAKAASPLNLFSAADSGKAKNDSSKNDTTRWRLRRAARSRSSFSRDRCRASISSPRPTCRRCRAISIAGSAGALPPGKVLRWGSDDVSAGNTSYATLYLVDCAPDHHRRVSHGRQAGQRSDRRELRRLHAQQRRRTPVPHRDRRSTSATTWRSCSMIA